MSNQLGIVMHVSSGGVTQNQKMQDQVYPNVVATRKCRFKKLSKHVQLHIPTKNCSLKGCAAPGIVPCQGNAQERRGKLQADSP